MSVLWGELAGARSSKLIFSRTFGIIFTHQSKISRFPKQKGIFSLLRALQTRLEFKILLLIVAVLILGFGSYVVITIQSESASLIEHQQKTLQVSTETLLAGIRNVMLTGKATFAVEMVNDVRQRVKFVDMTMFDRFGREVFLREGEGMNSSVHDPAVAEVLHSRSVQTAMMNEGTSTVFTRYEPLLNRPECWRCHDRTETTRGVLQVALKPSDAASSNSNVALRSMASMMGNTIATAFRTIMLGGNGEQMDTLMLAARSIPGVELVQVYGRDGFLQFGPEVYEIDAARITQFTHALTKDQRFEEEQRRLRMFIPLVNEDRCQVCHGAKFPMRGVMVVDFKKETLRAFLTDPEKQFTAAMQSTVSEGFRSIMLVGRANNARFYMDELRALGAIQTLRVYDNVGNERFLNPPPRQLDSLKAVVERRDTLQYIETRNGEERMVRISHLPNETRCHACHSASQKIRGVVEVSTSMAGINAEIRANKVRSVIVAGVTLLLVWLVIRYFMKLVVVGPVQVIEQVASKVGKGDFTVFANIASIDEIGNLAARINDMVKGLRERFHLEKFVSQQTVAAVRGSGAEGVRLGGERKEATVFFSDIRGFTAYSEKVEPERVVEMLNRCLSLQARIVEQFGGDIDKFVGDELMAVFTGDAMVERAVRTALEIQDTIHRSMNAADRKIIHIGIGINTGDMVMGAMGSDTRKDHTVIGDNVNLGARLCSAAAAKQILISESSANHIKQHESFQLTALKPILVKGKRAPIKIFEVRRAAKK